VTSAEPGLVARDGSAALVAVFAHAPADEAEVGERVQEALAGDPTMTLGGGALTGAAIGAQVAEDLARAELLAFPILFVLSLWVFRGVVAALLPLLVGLLTILATFLGLRVVNEATLLSVFALNLATGLGLGLAIDYTLFLVSRFREELGRGLEPRAAVAATLRTAGRTVLFSSLTVTAALLALLVFPQRFLYSMGIAGALTAIAAATASLTVLPALLVVLGHRVDALALRAWRGATAGTDHGFWYRLSRGVMRRPLVVAVATAAVLLAAGLPFARVTFTGVDASALPADAAPRVVERVLREDFPGSRDEPILVAVSAPRAAQGELRAYAERLRDLDGVAEVAPPRAVGDGTWQVDVVPEAATLDDRTLDLVAAVRAVPAPASALVGGQAARFVDQQAGLAARLPLALAVLAVTTVVILFAMTGSVVLPLKALLMNLLSLSAAFGLLVLVFQDGRLEGLLGFESQGALEATQPLVLLCLAFGLSTDYGVFLLHRIRRRATRAPRTRRPSPSACSTRAAS
jgi:uncharacterized membrane protein YdfJ with MMPL/SSD domain